MDIIDRLKTMEEVFWENPNLKAFKDVELPISIEDVKEAEKRLERFSSFIKSAFPEVKTGIIESETIEISKAKKKLEELEGKPIKGRLLIKRDDSLPIAGSIKARGGIYEVLKHAEELALREGILKETDDYSIINSDKFRKFFSQHKVQVGSTGNLGLSIGIMSAKLGFNVIVHMSNDAKQWKKDLLREKGARVVEYESDYSVAVEQGRAESDKDPMSYFVDDENSKSLFLGYAVAGLRIVKQLDKLNIGDSPIYAYLPCGVGGGPGGVAFGLKLSYGDRVNCYFAEPTHSPAFLLGMATGKNDKISVKDIGLDNITEADGLAVGRPSSFVGQMMKETLSGCYTIEDERLFKYMKALYESEGIFIEPSAAAGFLGAFLTSEKLENDEVIHLVWSTGGSLVPEEVRKEMLNR
ncbi:MAG: D-serine ammonia-lyase [Tissierellia bacterium]|nr:D-serine ammonia-lyase [Tissierellia bacterium]